MYYSKIRKYDTANGKGIRVTLFVSGCTHKCKGCFNQDAQSFTYGKLWTKEDENRFMEYMKDENIVGVNILGGEPMQQIMDESLINLLFRIALETEKDIWLWTGYTFEELMEEGNPKRKLILGLVDVLIDGRFIEEQRDLSLKYRGSKNQRVIDVQKSLDENKVVFYKID